MVLGGGETTTGMLTAAIAVGGVLAGLLSGALTRVRAQGRVIVWAITAWGLGVAAFGSVLLAAGRTDPQTILVPALIAALVTLAICGAAGRDSVDWTTTCGPKYRFLTHFRLPAEALDEVAEDLGRIGRM